MSLANTFLRMRAKNAAPSYEPSMGPLESQQPGAMPSMLDSRMADFGETRLPAAAPPTLHLPLLGERSVAGHQRLLSWLLVAALLALAGLAVYALSRSGQSTRQLTAVGQALMQSQRLAKSANQALAGDATAFAEINDSARLLARSTRGLQEGNDQLTAVSGAGAETLARIAPLAQRAEQNAAVLNGQQQPIAAAVAAVRAIDAGAADLQQAAETTAMARPSPGDLAQFPMLTQRIARSASRLLSDAQPGAQTAQQLSRDLGSFRDALQGLRDTGARDAVDGLRSRFEATRAHAETVLASAQGLAAARAAHDAILADSEPLRRELEQLQTTLTERTGPGAPLLTALAISALVALLAAAGMARVQLQDSRQRHGLAEQQRREAERQQLAARRVNDANQAAILRLMNELQTVAEGDLTQQASVTEDITGAIADSVNYTVEELRALVTSVQKTASRVAETTADVDSTSTELLAASTEQLREIHETGRSVLDMATRIHQVSTQAQESAQVARQSLQAADSGLKAVQDAIGGMNSIRDQIQETSKRIKRLGESSQEIGEITELISDITEQTNVLALNAAIQAASAGDAGRGFSVVAEEVQRLAERSGDATRQIAALVKAIQTDTQDAVAAMERSTQGVVAGARLSDSAGTALSEIDQVSRRLAELIEQISGATSREAELASGVAASIQHIFAVTEQTGEGTRATAQQVRELSHMADELRQSVARFKIA